MNINEGRLLNIEFFQQQYDKKYKSSGNLYYLKDSYYVFDNNEQRITYQDGLIKTINKVNKQIIYDKKLEGQVTILDILSGKNNQLDIGEIVFAKNGFIIPFSLKDLAIVGKITTVPSTGQPKNITLLISDDEKININVISSLKLGKDSIPKIDVSSFEIINLSE